MVKGASWFGKGRIAKGLHKVTVRVALPLDAVIGVADLCDAIERHDQGAIVGNGMVALGDGVTALGVVTSAIGVGAQPDRRRVPSR